MPAEVKRVVQRGLIRVGKQLGERRRWESKQVDFPKINTLTCCGEPAVCRFVIECSQPQLLHVVFALRAASRFACLLHGWKQQRNQNSDDRDHHQKFDQRKST